MTDDNKKRVLSPEDFETIDAIWMRIGALQRLKENALPPTAHGAWIYEAADHEIHRLIEELDLLFNTTRPPVD